MRLPALIGAGLCAIATASVPVAASAQATSGGGLGALLGGGGVPSLGGVGVGNAAGMLSYCLKNQLLGGASGSASTGGLLGRFTGVQPTPTPTATPTPSTAQGVLGRLLGRKDVQSSPGYTAGQAGQLQLGGERTLPVTGLQDQIKSRLCSAVLSRAKTFL